VPNEGLVRRWINAAPSDYEPKRDGMERRRFRLSSDSRSTFTGKYHDEVWYDEVTDFDPAGFNAAKRTYSDPEGGPAA
jgi:hypothetical protein